MQFAAAGQQPYAADPKQQHRHQQPEPVDVSVEVRSREIGDVHGQYHHAGKGAARAERAQLLDVAGLVATTAGLGSAALEHQGKL